MRSALIILTQHEAASFTARPATEGAHETLPYPPGSALLGYAASRLAGDAAFETLFYSGRVRFSDALPLSKAGAPAYPVPQTLMSAKHGSKPWKEEGGQLRLQPELLRAGRAPSQEKTDGSEESGPQWEALKTGAVTSCGTLIRPNLFRRLRTATKDGRAAPSQLFEVELLSAEGAPRYAASIEADDGAISDEAWKKLLNLFGGKSLSLGRAAHSAYGGNFACEVSDGKGSGLWPVFEAKDFPERLTVWALSDIALHDRFGSPSVHPSGEGAVINGYRLDAANSAIGTRRYAPWNAHLKCRDLERQVIAAGSVLSLALGQNSDAPAGWPHVIGAYQAAGLGRIAINHPMIESLGGNPAFAADASSAIGGAAASQKLARIPASSFKPSVPASPAKAKPPANSNSACKLVIGRATIELLSPLSLESGERIPGNDDEQSAVGLMRDANGLPAVPGASLQGALRHLWREAFAGKDEDVVFGKEASGGDGNAGTVHFGFGCLHDSNDDAVQPFPVRTLNDSDPVIKLLHCDKPFTRDHVKLNERHVVEGRAKFTRLAVPKGARFSFELSSWSTDGAETLKKLFGLMQDPAFRLGGASARGYGRIKLIRAAVHEADPSDPGLLRELRAQPPSPKLPIEKQAKKPNQLETIAAPSLSIVASVTLKPDCVFRIGTGARSLTTLDSQGSVRFGQAPAVGQPPIDIPMVRTARSGKSGPNNSPFGNISTFAQEPVITWTGGTAALRCQSPEIKDKDTKTCVPGEDQISVPGASLRGPLVHRMLFHLNCARGIFAEQRDAEKENTLVAELAGMLGEAKERTAASGETGLASRLIVNDGELNNPVGIQLLDHARIDRFSGGVSNGGLFSEEVIVCDECTSITFDIVLRPPSGKAKTSGYGDDLKEALVRALDDLCAGRLPIGADSLGMCTGNVAWKDSGGTTAPDWQTLWEKHAPAAPAGEAS